MRDMVAATLLVFVLGTAPLFAGRSTPVEEIAAAISLGEAGMTRQDAGLLITALEILQNHAPQGDSARLLRERYLGEAWFLHRGDPVLRRRLAMLVDSSPSPVSTVRIIPFASEISMAGSSPVMVVAVAGRATLRAVKTPNGQSCIPYGRVWRCHEESAVPGLWQLRGRAAGPAWLIIDTAPQ